MRSDNAAYSQKAVFETAAFEVVVKPALHIAGQFPVPLRQMGSDRRVVFFDDPIEQGLLGPLALVTTSILVAPSCLILSFASSAIFNLAAASIARS